MRKALRILASLAVLAGTSSDTIIAQQTLPGGSGPTQVVRNRRPGRIDFGPRRSDQVGAVRTYKVTNYTSSILFLRSADLVGTGASGFRVLQAPQDTTGVFGARPGIAPGKSRTLSVVFEPDRLGLFRAELVIEASRPMPWGKDRINLVGIGLGALGDELHLNAGGFASVDGAGDAWAADYAFVDGRPLGTGMAITSPIGPELYQTQRAGATFTYSLALPAPGAYAVTLHLAEVEHSVDGARVFDVYADGERVLSDVDIHAAVGAGVAHTLEFTGRAQDQVLDLDFVASVGQASVAAIEVLSMPLLEGSPEDVDFGALAQGEELEQEVLLTNAGSQGTVLENLALNFGASGTSQSFTVELDGQSYAGGLFDVDYDLEIPLAPGASLPMAITFRPLQEQYDVASLELTHSHGVLEFELSGLGGHEGDPYLHVVIEGEALVVDREGGGSAPVFFEGAGSHTHEPGRSLTGFQWSVDGLSAGTDPSLQTTLGLGAHTVALEITDDNQPGRSLTQQVDVQVLGTEDVPGVLALYYPAGPGQASVLLDTPPANADFAEVVAGFSLSGPANVGGSPYVQDVMVRLVGEVELSADASVEFLCFGGSGQRILVDGAPSAGPSQLPAGTHAVDARFAVNGLLDLPLSVQLRVDGGPAEDIPPGMLNHDESSLVPVISSMQDRGTTLGGNAIVIGGVGFFPSADVTVHWGDQDLTMADFTEISANSIRFPSPPGSAGVIAVTVETSRGISNARSFEYDASGPVPLIFVTRETVTVPVPTAGAWGPDGLLYVTALDGRLSTIEFEDDWTVANVITYPGVSALTNSDTLGITFDPYDLGKPGPIRVYVSHGQHFLNGGSSFTGPSDYTGQVSLLTGPNFDTPVPVVTGLPTSNHDHGMNEILFDNNGDLLISVGSNTNAGVRHPNSGDLPESPLSAALVLAETSRPDFNGNATYVETIGGAPNADQVFGEAVDLAPGVHLSTYATGLRNAYGVILGTNGLLYATDNGPNIGFGDASTGLTTQAGEPQDIDEILLVEWDGYYGHPNRARGRYDERENVYRSTTTSEEPGVFTQALARVPSSMNGLFEYRADTFGGQMRGDLVTTRWGSYLRRIELSEDGRQAVAVTTIYPWTGALDLLGGPGGALIALDYSGNLVRAVAPNDQAAIGLVVYDITPWRAPASGGAEFVIGGSGFGTLGNTSVSIGGRPATLLSVSPTRIRGIIPSSPSPSTQMLDVVVTSGGQSDTHLRAFRYLLGPGLEPGSWQPLDSLATPLGEVSAGVVGGIMYLVGEGSSDTYAFDLVSRSWLPNRATRPYTGHHHGGEVVDGKWYLVGGLGGGSEGRVQIYDPVLDSWSVGADMSWAGGSVSTAVIDGTIYAAGGIVGTSTVDNFASYDPEADAWTPLTRIPEGRNHAASASDGQRMYVFGGRTGGNWVGNGFDDLQVYDPLTDTWQASSLPGSTLAPLPQARGGMGSAVYYRGEFYVFGGETASGAGAVAGNVYDRVDVYDPATNTWRLEAPMPVPRHGIDAVLFGNGIYLPGGGVQAAFSQSAAFDTFRRP